MVFTGLGRLKALGALILLLFPGIVQASPQAANPAAASLTGIMVSFKLDPRLTDYAGERWLSPPTFTSAVQGGTVGTVDVKVRGVDARGKPVDMVPEWTAADPEMVTVTPGQKNEFRITVKRVGESKLRVASQGVSKELVVRAKSLGDLIQVEISQESVSEYSRSEAPAPDPGGTAPAEHASVLPDQKAKTSYAVGVEMGHRLKGGSLDLDAELVYRGLKDALTGDMTLLSEGEMKAALATLRIDLGMKHAEARKQLAEKNKEKGEAFLAENKTKEGVVTLESGLQYKVVKAGDGAKPALADTVVCHHRGTLVDGTEFDSSRRRNKPTTLALKRAIKGWSEALQLMPVGSKWQLFIPPSLAYGGRGTRGIGPNATLIFEVELLSIKGTAEDSARLPETTDSTKADIAGITLFFKLDPRLSQGLNGGERWVSPPTYTCAQQAKTCTVEARAQGVDASGMSVNISPQWVPADPDMVTVTPSEGNEVKITVQRPGESSLQVISQGFSKGLTIKAENQGDAIHVEIAQEQ